MSAGAHITCIENVSYLLYKHAGLALLYLSTCRYTTACDQPFPLHCCSINNYPVRTCAAGVDKLLKNASSRVAKAFTDIMLNAKQST